MNADSDNTESIPAVPADWSGLTNMQISKFAESIGSLLDAGIFPGGLAEELSAYRDKANEEMTTRLRRAEDQRAASDSDIPFRPVSMNGNEC